MQSFFKKVLTNEVFGVTITAIGELMEFTSIFTNMSWIVAVLLCVGLVFIFIEVLMPGFGFWGIAGGSLVVAGVTVRIVQGLTLVQSLTLILLVLAFLILMVMIMVLSAKRGILSKTGIFENRTSVPVDYNVTDKAVRKLVGNSGKALTSLNLGGKAKINGKVYNVQAVGSFIEKGSRLKVVAVKDNTIMVRKWFE